MSQHQRKPESARPIPPSAIATLARVNSQTPAPAHKAFWISWRKLVAGARPMLNEVHPTDPRAPGAHEPGVTHTLVSHDGAIIGCRLLPASSAAPLRAGLVCLHGAQARPLEIDARRWRRLAGVGVATLLVRLRGYPGSTPPPDSLHADARVPWILRGLDHHAQDPANPMRWIYPASIGDAACACLAMRSWLDDRAGRAAPMTLCGSSLGAGVAITTTAQLGEMMTSGPPVDRLALALPSMGDWPLRIGAGAGGGMGRTLLDYRAREPDLAPIIDEALRLADTSIHARRVITPALCMLALRDEIVPPAAAASVYNALATSPGCKARFIVDNGHTEGSASDLREQAEFHNLRLRFASWKETPADPRAGEVFSG